MPVLLAILTLLTPQAAARHFSTTRLLATAGIEVLLGVATVLRLRRRGWYWRDLTKPFEPRDLGRALGVFLLGYLAYVAGYYLAWAISPTLGETTAAVRLTGTAAWQASVLLSVINPIFEELLWLGYAVSGPGHGRMGRALAWSVGTRTLTHLYQGPLALFAIAPLGLWYFRYYWRSGRLWPIILAHGLQDLLGLLFALNAPAG